MRRFSAERALTKHMDRWHYLLGMGKWVVTYEIVDGPFDHEESVADNHYTIRKNGRRVSHIRFYRVAITSETKAEHAVVHELLHILDHGIGNDLHKFIFRLEPKLRMIRKRAK